MTNIKFPLLSFNVLFYHFSKVHITWQWTKFAIMETRSVAVICKMLFEKICFYTQNFGSCLGRHCALSGGAARLPSRSGRPAGWAARSSSSPTTSASTPWIDSSSPRPRTKIDRCRLRAPHWKTRPRSQSRPPRQCPPTHHHHHPHHLCHRNHNIIYTNTSHPNAPAETVKAKYPDPGDAMKLTQKHRRGLLCLEITEKTEDHLFRLNWRAREHSERRPPPSQGALSLVPWFHRNHCTSFWVIWFTDRHTDNAGKKHVLHGGGNSKFKNILLCVHFSARPVGFDDKVIIQDVVGVLIVEVVVERSHDVGVHVQPRSWGKTKQWGRVSQKPNRTKVKHHHENNRDGHERWIPSSTDRLHSSRTDWFLVLLNQFW